MLWGPNHTHSGYGHDKLMGFMNSTFPLAVYGLQDAYSGYILYLKLWTSNSDPKIIGRWYLEHLYVSKGENYMSVYINVSTQGGMGDMPMFSLPLDLRELGSSPPPIAVIIENRNNLSVN